MSFKNLKLGAKLAVGFGVLIALSVILGAMSVRNMSKITKQSKYLANEYVPEVKMATDLRGAANRAMYQMRGYGFTEEEEFYQDAKKEMELINQAILEGEALNERSVMLKALADELQVAEDASIKYFDLVEQTVEVNKALAEARETMDKSADAYLTNCFMYLDNQNAAMLREIRSKSTTEGRLQKITLINNIIDAGNAVRVGNFKSQATRQPALFREALTKFPEVHGLLDEIRKYTILEQDLLALKNIEASATDYEAAMDKFITNWEKRESLAAKRENAGRELIDACAVTTAAGLAGTQKIADEAINTLQVSSTAMISGLILALIIGVAFAFFLTRMITGPVRQGVSFAKQLANGDLTATINIDQEDEIGDLAKALTNMGTKLRSIVENILAGAGNIASASQQMSGTSQEMSQGASEQASSVEEVTSSMEQMVANIQQNTESAQTTERIAINAAKGIKEGSEATNSAVAGMKNIAEKIRIINDIAFQTNILALNAAVEAARAGEHGKGFAVVAAEVRKLAERSKVAADEIDELSRNGVETAERAGNKLNEIVPEIEKTAQLVQEIASASLEQNTGADQVNNAMQQLNNVTQQNAAASEEMATSSEELSSQADQLKEIIMYFKVDKRAYSQQVIKSQPVMKAEKQISKAKPGKYNEHKELVLSEKDQVKDEEFESF